jgi:hypothetical protein
VPTAAPVSGAVGQNLTKIIILSELDASLNAQKLISGSSTQVK